MYTPSDYTVEINVRISRGMLLWLYDEFQRLDGHGDDLGYLIESILADYRQLLVTQEKAE